MEEQNRLYDEIERHLQAFHLPSMHVTALTGLLMADVVMPFVRAAVLAEREACAKIAEAPFGSGLADRDDYWQPRIAERIRARP